MRHGTARRLLPGLLDDTLSPAGERELQAHVRGCARCRRDLTEFELCDGLVARLPLAVIPLIEPAGGVLRLERLACWTLPRPARRERLLPLEGAAAAAAAGLFAGLLAMAGASHWVPAPEPAANAITQVAYVTAGAAQN